MSTNTNGTTTELTGREVRALLTAASTLPGRYALSGLGIDSRGAYATDGCRMLELRNDRPEQPAELRDRKALQAVKLSQGIRLVPGDPNAALVDSEGQSAGSTIVPILDSAVSAPIDPDIRQSCQPSQAPEDPDPVQVVFTVRYLREMAQAFETLADKGVTATVKLTLYPDKEGAVLQGVRFEPGCGILADLEGLLMPVAP